METSLQLLVTSVFPVETLDPAAFCVFLQPWGLCGRMIYQARQWHGSHHVTMSIPLRKSPDAREAFWSHSALG